MTMEALQDSSKKRVAIFTNLCVDCQKPISSKAKRCRTCWFKVKKAPWLKKFQFKETNPNFCTDCGKKIQSKPRIRCSGCWKKFVIKRRNDKKPRCIDCGIKCCHQTGKKEVRCQKCYGKYRIKMKFGVGKLNPKWNGGITEFRNKVRHLPEYRQWRTDIFKRDNYTCVVCGGKGYLEADHYPKAFVELIRDAVLIYGKDLEKIREYGPLWDTTNGRTTCKKDNRKLFWGNKYREGIWKI